MAELEVWCRPMGTTIGVPDTGSGTTRHGMPNTVVTISSVTAASGGPLATMMPSFMAIRWSA